MILTRVRLYSTRMSLNTFYLTRIFSRFCAIFFVICRKFSSEFLLTWAQGGLSFSPQFLRSLKALNFGSFKFDVCVIHCDAPSQLQLSLPCLSRHGHHLPALISGFLAGDYFPSRHHRRASPPRTPPSKSTPHGDRYLSSSACSPISTFIGGPHNTLWKAISVLADWRA